MLHLRWPSGLLRKTDAGPRLHTVTADFPRRALLLRATPSAARRTLHIGLHRVLGVDARPGDELCCLDGLLWVTQEGCFDDETVRAGGCMRITHAGLALVQALATADVTVFRQPG